MHETRAGSVWHNILTNELALYKNFGKILFSQRILILPKLTVKQECIPVGCVPPALYRTGGGLCREGGAESQWTDPLPRTA